MNTPDRFKGINLHEMYKRIDKFSWLIPWLIAAGAGYATYQADFVQRWNSLQEPTPQKGYPTAQVVRSHENAPFLALSDSEIKMKMDLLRRALDMTINPQILDHLVLETSDKSSDDTPLSFASLSNMDLDKQTSILRRNQLHNSTYKVPQVGHSVYEQFLWDVRILESSTMKLPSSTAQMHLVLSYEQDTGKITTTSLNVKFDSSSSKPDFNTARFFDLPSSLCWLNTNNTEELQAMRAEGEYKGGRFEVDVFPNASYMLMSESAVRTDSVSSALPVTK